MLACQGVPRNVTLTHYQASRTLHRALASVCASLCLVGVAGDSLAAHREAVQGAGLTMPGTASPDALVCDTTIACFDILTLGANITHVFVDSACGGSPSDFAITVDGEPVIALHTDDSPCEHLPREVWFPLAGDQDEALVCVAAPGASPEDIQVHAKAGDECIAGTMP